MINVLVTSLTIFIILKLTHVIHWHWVWVLSPAWILPIFGFVLMLVGAPFAIISGWFARRKHSR